MSNHQHLINELESQHDAKVIVTKERSYPMFTTMIHYYPIIKTPMDILMKMMLIAFQKAPIKAPNVLANILLVEPLFIEDLTSKMVVANLIVQEENEPYQLTAKGFAQLQAGIFEERLELVSEEVYYSAIHETILQGDVEKVFELEDIPAPIEYASEEIESIHETNVMEALQHLMNAYQLEDEDDKPQTFITAIDGYEVGSIQDMPMVIFVLKETGTERLFARVYNQYTGAWDDELTQFVTDHEKLTWKR